VSSLATRLGAVGADVRHDLLAAQVIAAIAAMPTEVRSGVTVAEIDPDVADTAAFCLRYGVSPAESANCVVVAGRRGEVATLAACVVLATTRADVNGLVRRHLDVRKISFASMDVAVSESGMEYGGITPIGLPAQWPLLIDRAVVDAGDVVVGSGVRRSKIVVPGATLATLPNAVVLDGLGQPSREG
jgi:prolyl-tRNA editing enzyme YbaK/EbsC (Cys-tRNA(Pro) deacylase)